MNLDSSSLCPHLQTLLLYSLCHFHWLSINGVESNLTFSFVMFYLCSCMELQCVWDNCSINVCWSHMPTSKVFEDIRIWFSRRIHSLILQFGFHLVCYFYSYFRCEIFVLRSKLWSCRSSWLIEINTMEKSRSNMKRKRRFILSLSK